MSYFGAFFAHVGVLIAILGFLGNYRGAEKTITLKKGESIDFFDYHITFEGIRVKQQEMLIFLWLRYLLVRSGKQLPKIFPARAKYPTSEDLLHEIDLRSTFWHDLYVSLLDFDRTTGQKATLELHFNPSVRLVWISLVFFVFGGFLSFLDSRRSQNRDMLVAYGGNNL